MDVKFPVILAFFPLLVTNACLEGFVKALASG